MTTKNKKILIICPHPVGYVPGQRLKYEQYFNHWRNNGYELTIKPFFSESTQQVLYKKGHYISKITGTLGGYFKRLALLFSIRRHDLVYVFLWVTPFGPPFFEWLTRKTAKKIIYDIDDLVFLKHRIAEPWYAYLLKGREKPIYLMKTANHIITCTPYLDEFARKYNQHTTDISSTINTDHYKPVNKYTNDHQIVLGWSGSHSTLRMLKLILPALIELKKSLDYKLVVMGGTDIDIPGIVTEKLEWTEEKEISTLQKMDIGLYPLPIDEEWVKGKSGLKALQYMALGIPTIASNCGCNDRVIENGVSGFLVSTQEEWVEKIILLANDAALRKSMGRAARETVEKTYSVKANEAVYLKILDSLVTNKVV
ncbi:MAG: glycosyltransferase family 4 protein [Chitinophagaceae bacterium]